MIRQLCPPTDHVLTVVYIRPWRAWWRKRNLLVCWHCTLRIEDPAP